MVDRRLAIAALLAGATSALVPRRVRAAAESEWLELDAMWAGLQVAVVRLETERTGPVLDSRLFIETQGIAALVTDWNGRMISTSRNLVPQRFRVRNQSKRYTRDIAIDYDAKGRIQRLDIRKRDEPQRLPFDIELARGTVDPLTAIARLRKWASGDTSEPAVEKVFDGRARYDLKAQALIEADERRRVKLSIRPIAGSSESSWLKHWEPDDGRWIEARLSADSRAVPHSLQPRGVDSNTRIELARDLS